MGLERQGGLRRKVGQAVGIVDGRFRGASGGKGGGGSPELEKMMVVGEGKRAPVAGLWLAAGMRTTESGNKRSGLFFLFWQPKLFVSQIGVCRRKAHFLHVHAVVTPLIKISPLLLTSW